MYTVPRVHATLSGSGGTPVAGQPYTLSCGVNGDKKLNSAIIYHWMQNNGTAIQLKINSADLSFSSLRLSNSGNYSCSAVVNSSYLNEAIIAASNLFSIQFEGKSDCNL